MILQAGFRRIAAGAITGQHQQQQQHRMIIRAIQQNSNNTVLRQLPIGHSPPNRIRSSTIAPLVQQLTHQMLWSQQHQSNISMTRSFMATSSWTRIPEPAVADMISSTVATTETTTSRSMISLNLECGVLEEDDDGYVNLL